MANRQKTSIEQISKNNVKQTTEVCFVDSAILYICQTRGPQWPLYRSPVLIGPLPGDLVLNQVKVILTILVGNDPRIIPMKFQRNWTTGLGGVGF